MAEFHETVDQATRFRLAKFSDVLADYRRMNPWSTFTWMQIPDYRNRDWLVLVSADGIPWFNTPKEFLPRLTVESLVSDMKRTELTGWLPMRSPLADLLAETSL